jgi:hypothetical protein
MICFYHPKKDFLSDYSKSCPKSNLSAAQRFEQIDAHKRKYHRNEEQRYALQVPGLPFINVLRILYPKY